MKQWEKLKKRVAALLIVTLAVANTSMSSLAAINLDDLVIGDITVTANLSEIYVGETAKFNAEIASVSEASGSSASWSEASMSELEKKIKWTLPGGLEQKSASGSELIAEGTAQNSDATVTAELGGKTGKTSIKVLDPKLTVNSSKIKMNYGDSFILKAEINENQLKDDDKNKDIISATPSELTPNIDVDGVGVGTDLGENEFEISAKDGFYGDFEVLVSANLTGLELKPEVVNVTINPPEFTVEADDNKLDVLTNPTTTLRVQDTTDLFGDFQWSVKDPEILKIGEGAGEEAEITALKAGKTIVEVEGTTNIKVGPSNETHEQAKIKAQATITVTDSREFKVEYNGEEEYIELDINPDPEKRKLSDTVKISNSYEGDLAFEVTQDPDFELVQTSYDGATGILTISTDGSEVGSATVKVSVGELENPAPIEIPVVVKNSEVPVEVLPSLAPEIRGDAVKEPEANLEGLTLEQAAQVTEAISELVDTIKGALTDAFSAASASEELSEMITGLQEIANLSEELQDGDLAFVYPKQVLNNVEFETTLVKNEETGEVKPVLKIKKLVFDISLYFDKLTPDGNSINGESPLNVSKDNTTEISFPVPLPAEGIDSNAKYAKITHGKDVTYSPIRESDDGIRYTMISTYTFSPFVLEFVEKLPTTTISRGSSGGGKGHSYHPAGTWQSDATGWYLRQPNGTKAANCWLELSWNGVMQWYRFNETGYMATGWFNDVDGNTYFLHNISDGNQGYMYTGWKQIGGIWYYFRDYTGGPKGSLLRNGVTPDGYITDANGACLTYPLK